LCAYFVPPYGRVLALLNVSFLTPELPQMMTTLLESRPVRKRSTGGTIFSVGFHAAILFFAIFATARAGVAKDDQTPQEKVHFVKVKKADPPPVVEKKPEPPKPQPKKAAPPKAPKLNPLPVAPKAEIAPPKGFKVLEAPVNVPVKIPDIDLSKAVTNENDFSGKGVKGGSSTGVEGSEGTREGAAGGSAVNTDKTYAEFEVERVVEPISGTAVAYPEAMRTSGAEGRVLAQFVVNESGRVETATFKVLESSNPAFTAAVKAALPRMKFRPAQIGKTNVQQVVQQAFVFQLNR
jgi:protein TonB